MSSASLFIADQHQDIKNNKLQRLRVCICTSFVIDPVKEYIDYWCKEFELNVDVFLSPYNQVFQQLLNPQSELNQNTGVNILLIRIEDWLRDLRAGSPNQQKEFLLAVFSDFTEAIRQSRQVNPVPYLVATLPISDTNSFEPEILKEFVQLKNELETFLKTVAGLNFIDLNDLISLYNVEEIFDPKSDEIGHIPFTQEYYAALGTFLARKVRAYIQPAYKVIALDCDNTLWKGVCGEDGPLNVVIDANYSYLQNFMLEKYKQGFLLVLCSKNNEADVWEVFEQNKGMLLKREHFAAHRINWNPKPGNLKSIAKELNVGVDSFIFLDDSNYEIEQMAMGCPQVLSVELPADASSFFSFLNHIWEFDVFTLTDEDLQRNNQYKAERLRKEEQGNYEQFNDFLKSLNIKVDLHRLEEKNLDRALQLTLRTNQFNLNGIRKRREELQTYIEDTNSIKWVVEVSDRFGNYGLVGLVLAKEMQKTLAIETFLLSCRVLGRNVEDFILSELGELCLLKGLPIIKAEFRLTEKNTPFSEFLTRTGWFQDEYDSSYCYFVTPKEQ